MTLLIIAKRRVVRRSLSIGFVLAVSVFGFGCASGPPAPSISRTEVVAGGPTLSDSYRLSPGDDVTLRFEYFSDLNDEITIGPDGNVSLRLVGSTKLAGLTIDEAEHVLNDRFAEQIREPTITLGVKQYALQQIYVAGEVNTPGVVRDTVPLTLSHALAEAGGVKLATARLSQVILVRRGLDGVVKYYEIDLGNGITPSGTDPVLNSYDLVYVPEMPISQLADFVSLNLLRMIPNNPTVQITQ